MRQIMSAILWFIACLIWPVHGQAVTWPNEPVGATVLMDCDGGSLSGACQWSSTLGTPTITDLPDTGQGSPTKTYYNLLPANQNGGGWQVEKDFTAVTQTYVGVWWKMNATFQGNSNNGNKLFFEQSTSLNDYFGFYGAPGSPSFTFFWSDQNSVGVNNDHLGYISASESDKHVGLGCTVARDTWYRIEAYIRTGASSISRDATVKWWLNGTLCGNYTNVNFPGSIFNYVETHTWNGGNGNTQDWIHYIDHIRISTGGTPGGDTTPPAPPTGVTVTILAAVMIFGGIYGSLTANRVPIHRLALGHDHAPAAALRTVAVRGGADGDEAVYVVPVADRAGRSAASVLDRPAHSAASSPETKDAG